MVAVFAAIVSIAAFVWTLHVRAKDIPEPIPVSPIQHLEGRKAAIYENLRDLQFEFRLGKLSDDDYQRTKIELQAELAGLLAEIDQLRAATPRTAPLAKTKPQPGASANVCPHCNARFDKA